MFFVHDKENVYFINYYTELIITENISFVYNNLCLDHSNGGFFFLTKSCFLYSSYCIFPVLVI